MLKPLQTVTLPVLVDASRENADGWYFPNHDTHVAVRAVSEKEVEKRLKKIFNPKEVWKFVGVRRLKWAHNRKDDFALRRAMEELEPWAPGPWNLKSGKRVNWTGVRFIYAGLISDLIKRSQLVMWCSDKEEKFLRGMYCPDWKTAAFVMSVMEKIRVCPKCGEGFVPDTDNQDYCKPSHGVAYRTARSRAKRKGIIRA